MKIPSKIPGKLSIRGGDQPLFTGGTAAYNYALGGLPWLSAASNIDYGRRRIKRATAPFRKDQIDQQVNAGEQSLAGYWLRSGLSFHGGAGLLYSDTGQVNPYSDIRFYRSKNVNPWEQGVLSLLQATHQTSLSGTRDMVSFIYGNGTSAVAGVNATNFFTLDTAFNLSSAAFAAVPYSITSDGSNLYVIAADGLYKAPINSTSIGSWTKIYTATVTRSAKVAWVKERIILAVDQSLYECVPSPAGPPAALPTALYTAQSSGWNWTAITETTTTIYAVGNVGAVSSIVKFGLVDTSGTVTLSGGTVAATLPGGEVAWTAFGYLGNRVGLGTSKGARVATADDSGSLSYGPLIVETTSPVLDFSGRDRFLWCSYSEATETDIRLARIDLSLEIEPGRFAYATDLVGSGDTGNTTCIAFVGTSDQICFSTSTNLWTEDPNLKPTSGYLDTSRIRFSTLEPKVYRSFRIRGPQLEGPLAVSLVEGSGSIVPVYVYGEDQTPGAEDIDIPQSPPTRDFLAFRFTLEQGSDTSKGAEMNGWQMKALPAAPRQRIITLPVWCFDFEKDKHGQRVGGHGQAVTRLLAMEDLESSGQVVQLQDLDSGITHDVFIESMEYQQVEPPPHFAGWGGIIFFELRTV